MTNNYTIEKSIVIVPYEVNRDDRTDKFSYNIGGNVGDGTKGTDLTFAEFAEVFGVYDILDSSGAQTGTISDMYVI